MADDFDAAGVNSWWNINTSRATTTSTSSDITASSYDNSPAIQPSTTDVGISGLHHIPGFTMDWNQSLLRSNTSSSGRAEPSFHAMLQDSYNYPSSIESGQFFQPQQQQHQHQHQHQQQQVGLFPMMLQGLFEPEPTKAHQQPNFDPHSLNYSPHAAVTMMGSSISDSLQKLPQFLKSSPPAQPPPDQLQFSNNTDFWNASEVRSPGFYSAAAQMPVQFEQKPSCSTSSRVSTTKSNSESAVSKRSGGSGSEPALKKTRTETLSPLPTFKVRKEKLSDRITALQQLVSPFGKTDTASVLHEAIEYIKFLHEQVNVLTSPYLKNGNPMQHQQSSGKSSKDGDGGPKQDLRSRGLCLVPVESTYPVASETTADFWPSFGGSYR